MKEENPSNNLKSLVLLSFVSLLILSIPLAFTVSRLTRQKTEVPSAEKVQSDGVLSDASIAETETSEVLLNIKDGDQERYYKVPFVKGDTAWKILQETSQKYGFGLEYQEYDFGVMITQIGNQTPPEGKYWMYYVNREMASVGADAYEVKAGDEILWILE